MRTVRGMTLVVTIATGVFVLAPPALASAGDLDTTFSGDGKVLTQVGGSSIGADVAIQSDGKVVVAGGEGFALARYRTNGTLDPAFGTNGKVQITIGASSTAFALAIQSDGKIVVVGDAVTNAGRSEFAVARLKDDGSLDPSFSGDGKLMTGLLGDSGATAVAIQADGAIVVAGSATGSSHTVFATVRYTAAGARDASFGDGDGIVLSHFTNGSDDSATGVAIQSDGKIVVGGTHATTGIERFGLIRYGPLGHRDGSFGSGGKVTTAFAGSTHSEARAVQIRTNGAIVVAGLADPQGVADFAVVQYLTDGALDPAFGGGDGEVTTHVSPGAGATDLARQSNGMVVVAGSDGGGDMALVRYTTDGTPDPSFSGDGIVRTSFGNGVAFANGVAIQSNGRIVAAGGSVASSEHRFAVARYLAA